MELGQRIKEARLEKGLSQRELCGNMITRNMLSLIENGSARPSMDTLRYLARALEKPMSYFLGEVVISPNQTLILDARNLSGEQVIRTLQNYQTPDPVFDPERYLLEALTCLDLAQEAIGQKKQVYALTLLERAQAAGEKTPYYTQTLRRRKLLLQFQAGVDAQSLAVRLPDLESELLLRAQAALDGADPEKAAAFLEAATTREPYWYYLRGEAFFANAQYGQAAESYLQAENWLPQKVYARLEQCYKALGDYKNAYEYACKQR